MNPERAVHLLKDANPAPDVDSVELPYVSGAGYLAALEQRSGTMQTDEIRKLPGTGRGPRPPKRWRGPAIAAAAAVVVLVALGIGLWLVADDNNAPVVDQPPVTTVVTPATTAPPTPTTVPPPTTAAAPATPAAIAPDPISVALEFLGTWNTGDVDTHMAMLTPDAMITYAAAAVLSPDPEVSQEEAESVTREAFLYRTAVGMVVDVDGCERVVRRADGDVVKCTVTAVEDLMRAAGQPGSPIDVQLVIDGDRVVRQPANLLGLDAVSVFSSFHTWATKHFAEEYAAACGDGHAAWPRVGTTACAAFTAAHATEWAAA